jgi:hypothetical protein
MKKNILKSAFAALAVSAVAVTASSVAALAYDGSKYPVGDLDPSTAKIKPIVSIDKIEIEADQAGTEQKVNINVAEGEDSFGAFGLHIVYDSKLELVAAKRGALANGPAIEGFSFTSKDIEKGVAFITGACDEDYGTNGVLATATFKVPADAQPGDVFAIGFDYRSNPTAEDCFTNSLNNADGKLMQAWVFTQGLQDGYIKIKGEVTTTTTTTTTTTETTTAEETTTTAAETTAAPESTTTSQNDAPPTGVKGVGVAVAGLAVAVGAAFALRKRED